MLTQSSQTKPQSKPKPKLKIKRFSELFVEIPALSNTACSRCGFKGEDRNFYINKRKGVVLCEYCYHYYYNQYKTLLEKNRKHEQKDLDIKAIISRARSTPETQVISIDGKEVGSVKGDIYTTTRRYGHFMKIYRGFGLSESILKQLQDLGVKYVLIKYNGKRESSYFLALLSQYLKSEKSYHFGNDFQKFVSIDDMLKLRVR